MQAFDNSSNCTEELLRVGGGYCQETIFTHCSNPRTSDIHLTRPCEVTSELEAANKLTLTNEDKSAPWSRT